MSSDPVAEILAQWRRERPELDFSGSAVLLRVLLLERHLFAHVRRSLEPAGLSPGEFDVLGALRRAGAPYRLSCGDLAEATLLTCSGMTHRLDVLERRGLIGRSACEADRRRVMVELTDDGRSLVDQAVELRTRDSAGLMARLDESERRELERLLGKLLGLLGEGR